MQRTVGVEATAHPCPAGRIFLRTTEVEIGAGPICAPFADGVLGIANLAGLDWPALALSKVHQLIRSTRLVTPAPTEHLPDGATGELTDSVPALHIRSQARAIGPTLTGAAPAIDPIGTEIGTHGPDAGRACPLDAVLAAAALVDAAAELERIVRWTDAAAALAAEAVRAAAGAPLRSRRGGLLRQLRGKLPGEDVMHLFNGVRGIEELFNLRLFRVAVDKPAPDLRPARHHGGDCVFDAGQLFERICEVEDVHRPVAETAAHRTGRVAHLRFVAAAR